MVSVSAVVFTFEQPRSCRFSDAEVQRDIKLFPFDVVSQNGKPYFQVNITNTTKTFSPEEVSAMVLSKMKHMAEESVGHPVADAVITVPAYFSHAQRQVCPAVSINCRRWFQDLFFFPLQHG